MKNKSCTCGSNKNHYPLYDAAGIFCTYVCEECETKKKRKFKPEIFEDEYAARVAVAEFYDDIELELFEYLPHREI